MTETKPSCALIPDGKLHIIVVGLGKLLLSFRGETQLLILAPLFILQRKNMSGTMNCTYVQPLSSNGCKKIADFHKMSGHRLSYSCSKIIVYLQGFFYLIAPMQWKLQVELHLVRPTSRINVHVNFNKRPVGKKRRHFQIRVSKNGCIFEYCKIKLNTCLQKTVIGHRSQETSSHLI